MIRTRHAILAVVAVIIVLVGLLIAVRAFAPDETEFMPTPAAVFSAVNEAASYTVTVLELGGIETARAELVQKLRSGATPKTEPSETEMPMHEPEPIAAPPVESPPVEEDASSIVAEDAGNSTKAHEENVSTTSTDQTIE
jgi:hypothetical protein